MPKVLEISDYSFWYPDGTQALKEINLEVDEGELLTVMGRNGAGKTTLCLSIVGIIPNIFPGEIKGRINIMGKNPIEHYVYEITKDIGLVLQDPESQIFTHSVLSEVVFAAENLGLPRDEIIERANWALEIVDLKGFEKAHPRNLSGGQKQRLAIAAALVTKPKMLVLDEPTSQLDPVGTREVLATLKKLKEEEGMTILMTEHKTDEIAEISDRVVVLEGGRIVEEGEPAEVLTNIELLRKLMLKPPEIGEFYWELKGRGVPVGKLPVTLTEGEDVLRKLFEEGIIIAKDFTPNGRQRTYGDIVIEVRDVSFEYKTQPPVKALDNVSFTIREGEFVGIIGKNGSGKTTLMKCLVGLLKPDSGKILFEGEDISNFTAKERAKRIGLVLQNPDTQLFSLSVSQEIEFGLRNIGLSREEIVRRRDEVLKLVGLEQYENLHPFQLSFGDRKKLAVASIVAMNPKVLIMDEPTTGQDHRGRYEICDLAKMLNKRGITILMVTHDMDLVAKYTERVLVMNEGRVIFDGPTREAFKRIDILRQAGLMPPRITLLARSASNWGIRQDILSVEEFLCSLESREVGLTCPS
jgi:energy-coupling factor transport system ATP-binding protein